jgi:regulator of sigma E protease
LGKVEEGSAAAAAGLQSGDVLISVAGKEFVGGDGYDQFVALIESSAGRPLEYVVERDGQRVAGQVTPADKEGKGMLGVALGFPLGVRKYAMGTAFTASLAYNWKQAGLLFATLKKLVTGNLSPRTLSGPLEIGALTGEAVRVGWVPFFTFMALVSLQLGVVNLLPIPVLDGGHIFILLIEGVMRRDLSMKLKERVLQFGFIVLLLIMGGVIFLDIDKMGFFKGLLGQ